MLSKNMSIFNCKILNLIFQKMTNREIFKKMTKKVKKTLTKEEEVGNLLKLTPLGVNEEFVL